ncbi:MAG TPA: type II toxin-antitoxin system HigB family toxin [Phycisphaerae bacterium]|nr:type II toxin-antitoxin system HigB family toxin [Phycisphaerae bacterium]
MRIIKTSTLKAFYAERREAEASLKTWIALSRAAEWRSFADVRKTFPTADAVVVASGRSVVVFNIAHNRYRLITAVHYRSQIVFTLRVLAHKEYDRDLWRQQL